MLAWEKGKQPINLDEFLKFCEVVKVSPISVIPPSDLVSETPVPYQDKPSIDLGRLAEVVQVLHQHLGARLSSRAFGVLCAEAYLESVQNPDLQDEALIQRLQPLIRMALAGAG